MNNKRLVSMALCTAFMASLCGCQKNPEKSVVVHKDMDNLIEEAQDTENGIVDVAEAVENYDSYQAEFSSDSLNVSVKADAKVDIPEVGQLSVYRVSQKDVSQELADKLIAAFMPGETLYDGSALNIETRAEIEEEIQAHMEQMNETDSYVSADEDKQILKEEQQDIIDELEEKFENAPEVIDMENFISDGKLRTADEWLAMGGYAEYYEWQKSLNEDGEILYAVTENCDKKLYIQNNSHYGNCIRFVKGDDICSTPVTSVFVDSTDLERIDNNDKNYEESALIWPAGEAVPSGIASDYGTLKDTSTAQTTISEGEAEQMADELLEAIGIDDFELSASGKYSEMYISDNDNSSNGYQTYYVLQYMRVLDGTMVTFDDVAKHEEGWSGDNYTKNFWPVESIEFRINDDGIVGFTYNAPLEVTETVVDKTAIKSFVEIKDTFEEMALITNASDDENEAMDIDINRVVLGYARISEADSFDTGLMVPVWDFVGTTEMKNEEWTYYSAYGGVMTINAIDGTVIDRSLGY